jgi:hypothetical protein
MSEVPLYHRPRGVRGFLHSRHPCRALEARGERGERIRSSVPGGLIRSERKRDFSAEPVPVSACDGSSKNLRDLKDENTMWRAGGEVVSAEAWRMKRPSNVGRRCYFKKTVLQRAATISARDFRERYGLQSRKSLLKVSGVWRKSVDPDF